MQGKVAVVTGAAGGIGRATARLLARQGVRVLVVDVKVADAEQTVAIVEGEGGAAHFHAADVASEDQVKGAVEDAVRRWGAIHILVNNAGINLVKFLEDTTVEEWDWLMAVNVRSMFLFCQTHRAAYAASRRRQHYQRRFDRQLHGAIQDAGLRGFKRSGVVADQIAGSRFTVGMAFG